MDDAQGGWAAQGGLAAGGWAGQGQWERGWQGSDAEVRPSSVVAGETGGSNCVAFHPIKNVIAISSTLDNAIGLFSFSESSFRETSNTMTFGVPPRPPNPPNPLDEVISIVFDPKYPIMISGTKNGIVRIWSISDDGLTIYNNSNYFPSPGVGAEVTCIAIHPVIPVFVVGFSNRTLVLYHYDRSSGITNIRGNISRQVTHNVSSVAFHPQLPVFITGNAYGTVSIYKFNDREMSVFDLNWDKKHTILIESIEFHNTLPFILFCSQGGGIEILSYNISHDLTTATTANLIYRSISRTQIYHAAFHPTEAVIMASTAHTAMFFTFTTTGPTELTEIGEQRVSHQLVQIVRNKRSCGFHRTLNFCFISCDDRVYIYDTSKLTARESMKRFGGRESMNPFRTTMFNELGRLRDKVPRADAASSTECTLSQWRQLNPDPGQITEFGQSQPNTGLLPPGFRTPDGTMEGGGTKGRRKTLRNVKKRVRKTKKYRKRRVTHRTRK